MKTTNYVDGFVLVVPKDKSEEYKQMAEQGRDMWMKYGALAYVECKGEDLAPKEIGGFRPLGFTELAKAKEDEDVWFSFITYKSREHRDEVNTKVMQEMDAQAEQHKDFVMPFEMNRMATGGFTVEVSGE